MEHKKFTLTFFILILMLASLACSIFIGGPDYPTQTVPASTSEVQTMQTQMAEAFIAGAQSGVVTLTITESQLTSLIAAKILAQENPPFTDPQVFLRDNQLQVYGKIKRGSFTANMLITASVGVDPATGTPKVEIVTADFGPFAAPDGLNSTVSAVVAEAFTGSLGPVATGFRLELITIANGVMTLVGRIK
jgi:hypothetical protein